MSAAQRQDWVMKWLTEAVKLVDVIEQKEIVEWLRTRAIKKFGSMFSLTGSSYAKQ